MNFDKTIDEISLTSFGVRTNSKDDQTVLIQKAFKGIANTGKKLIIPKGEYWISGTGLKDNERYLYDNGGIKVYSNSNIKFEEGAVFKIIPNSFSAYNCLRLWNVRNVKIAGGKIVGDRDKHKGKNGEWGHGIFIGGVANVSISNMVISSFWGDGININTAEEDKEVLVNRNVIISEVTCLNNRRQGLSIEAGKDINILHSKFISNYGTAPQSGIDIEPWSDNYPNVERILIKECEFVDNPHGVIINYDNLKAIRLVSNIFRSSKVNTVKYHFWQLNGLSEVEVSDCKFDSKAINMLINSGRKTIIKSSHFESDVKINSVTNNNVRIENSTFKHGTIIIEKEDNSDLSFCKNKFELNSKINGFGGRKLLIDNNQMYDSKDVFISDLSNAPISINGNYFSNSVNQAITTNGNVMIKNNFSIGSEVFIAVKLNSKQIIVSENEIETRLGQVFSFSSLETVTSLKTENNKLNRRTELLKDFQKSIKNIPYNLIK
ncbi:right-handed parallel beta-helix repeat-containing protein [Sphingobacterium multivorum]|nr:right-handed parallel beta-helix repeat-containing protein [Sphingobacterium multivorum]QQT63617.1 right-handed parallel beta-helix repeat-containing protein [Sphingobacterium multivorum]